MARMISRANAIVDVLRDSDLTDIDEYGDPVQTGATPLHTREPALIVSEVVAAPGDADVRITRRPIARMRPDIDVQAGDRLRDTHDGAIYVIETVERPRFSPGRLLDVRLELTRTT